VSAVPAHDTAHLFNGLWRDYLIVLGVVGALVVLAILFAAVRFRRRDPDGWGSGPSRAPRLELAYLVVISLIVVGLLTLTFRTEDKVDSLSSSPSLRISVTAYQWQWRFGYPNGAVVVGGDAAARRAHLPTLVVPQNEVVQFTLRSSDVLHELFIPAMRFKQFAYPNYTNRFDLAFPNTGRMSGACAQFCGLAHAQMRFSVLVLSQSQFRTWLAAHAPGAHA
jgi:cytochrome c oxidase subunit 2